MTLEKFYKFDNEAELKSFIELMPDTQMVIITSSGKDRNWSTDSAKGLFETSFKSMLDRGVYIKTSKDFHEWKVREGRPSYLVCRSVKEQPAKENQPFTFDTDVPKEDLGDAYMKDQARKKRLKKKYILAGLIVFTAIVLGALGVFLYSSDEAIIDVFVYSGIFVAVFIIYHVFGLEKYTDLEENES